MEGCFGTKDAIDKLLILVVFISKKERFRNTAPLTSRLKQTIMIDYIFFLELTATHGRE